MARTDGIIRGLTPGEHAIAASVFGDTLDLAAVRIRRAKWSMFQPAWVAMAPDGDIWLHPNGNLWCDDFACAPRPDRCLFVHEMTHVWQRAQGINLVTRRPPWATYRYLPLVPGKNFGAYGLEQQASIVEDWYRLREGGHVAGAPPIKVYAALIPFAP